MTNYSKFDVWKESEAIAMHFNGLLMQLRLRALAAVGLIVSLTGVISKTTNGEFNWSLLAIVLAVLLISWLAIFMIDNFYYKKLLYGAVASIIELEKTTDTDDRITLNLSRKVRDQAGAEWPVYWFYGLIGATLCMLLVLSLKQAGVICLR